LSASVAIHPEVAKLEKDLIAHRRHFHQNPELAFEEVETGKYIAEQLKSYGIPVIGVAGTGVVGLLIGEKKNTQEVGRVICLRADMDALPVPELDSELNKEYKSKKKM